MAEKKTTGSDKNEKIKSGTGSTGNPDEGKTKENKQDNTDLIKILRKISGTMVVQIIGVIVTLLVAVFTLFVAIYTADNAKSTSETTEHIARLVNSTTKVVSKAGEMAESTADIARSTALVAHSTAKVADYTKKLIIPILTIYCSIENDFDCKIDDGFSFKANQYLWKEQSRKETKFYIAVKNDWQSNIRGELKKVGFKVSVVNKDKEVLQSNIYFQKIPLQHLGPSEISEIIEANEFKRQLKEDFNWRGISDRTIKIEIDKMGIEVSDYPSAGVNVIYLPYQQFKKTHKKLKEAKSKGVEVAS